MIYPSPGSDWSHEFRLRSGIELIDSGLEIDDFLNLAHKLGPDEFIVADYGDAFTIKVFKTKTGQISFEEIKANPRLAVFRNEEEITVEILRDFCTNTALGRFKIKDKMTTSDKSQQEVQRVEKETLERTQAIASQPTNSDLPLTERDQARFKHFFPKKKPTVPEPPKKIAKRSVYLPPEEGKKTLSAREAGRAIKRALPSEDR